MRGQTLLEDVSRYTSPLTLVAPHAFRQQIETLRALMDDFTKQAADVMDGLEGFAMFGEFTSFPTGGVDFYSEVQRFEVFLITNALRQTRGSQIKAARLLKLNNTTLNTKVKTLRINYREYRESLLSRNVCPHD